MKYAEHPAVLVLVTGNFLHVLNFVTLFQVNIIEKSEIHQCLSCGDPHYYPLQPYTFGRLVNQVTKLCFVPLKPKGLLLRLHGSKIGVCVPTKLCANYQS